MVRSNCWSYIQLSLWYTTLRMGFLYRRCCAEISYWIRSSVTEEWLVGTHYNELPWKPLQHYQVDARHGWRDIQQMKWGNNTLHLPGYNASTRQFHLRFKLLVFTQSQVYNISDEYVCILCPFRCGYMKGFKLDLLMHLPTTGCCTGHGASAPLCQWNNP